jgi:hypothetical protein
MEVEYGLLGKLPGDIQSAQILEVYTRYTTPERVANSGISQYMIDNLVRMVYIRNITEYSEKVRIPVTTLIDVLQKRGLSPTELLNIVIFEYVDDSVLYTVDSNFLKIYDYVPIEHPDRASGMYYYGEYPALAHFTIPNVLRNSVGQIKSKNSKDNKDDDPKDDSNPNGGKRQKRRRKPKKDDAKPGGNGKNEKEETPPKNDVPPEENEDDDGEN